MAIQATAFGWALPGWDVVARGAFEGAPGGQNLLWRNASTSALVEWASASIRATFLILRGADPQSRLPVL